MLIDNPTFVGSAKSFSLESGTSLPSNPKANLQFILTATDGAYAPGNYIYLNGVWTCGDISGVTAGTGLTGGGTNGNVTLNVDMSVVASREYVDSVANTSGVSQSYVDTAISNLINMAPSTLDTLGEIAARIVSGESTVGALSTQIAGKQDDITAGFGITKTGATISVSPAAVPYDITVGNSGVITANALLQMVTIARKCKISAGFSGSIGYAKSVATASTSLIVKVNGTQIGTITFAASSATPTFSAIAETTLNIGDRIEVVGPATADTTLADIAITIAAYLVA